MKAFINRLTANWNVAIVFLGFAAWGSWFLARLTGSGVMWAMFAIYATVIGGMMMRWQWARKAGLALLIWLCVGRIHSMVTREFTWQRLGYAGALGFVAYGLWKKPDNGIIDDFADEEGDIADDKENSKPIISLVHLRSQQRYLEAPVLANALSEAWDLNIVGSEAHDVNAADGFVAGQNPIFIVMVTQPNRAMFLVHNHDQKLLRRT